MAEIRWELLRPVDVGAQVQQGFATGSALVKDFQQQRALNVLSAHPTDQGALAGLFRVNPSLATDLEERARKMQARSALADYALGQSGGGAATSAGTPAPAGGGALSAFGPAAPGAPSPAAPTSIAPKPGLSSDAYATAMRADPEGTLKFQGQKLDVTKKQLLAWKDLNSSAMQLLGGVTDQDSYDAAKERAAELYAAHGINIADLHLPDEYSPEAVEALRLQGMDTAKQMAAIARENRIQWDISDDEADNAETRRYHDRSLSIRERAADRPRGSSGRPAQPKPATPTTVVGRIMDKQARGEPLTSAEQRTYDEYRAGRGRKSGAVSAGDGAVIRNPKTGERLRLESGRWVPIK